MGPNPLEASLPEGFPAVLESPEQLENQLKERETSFDTLIERENKLDYSTRYAYDLNIYELREKIRILKAQKKRPNQ